MRSNKLGARIATSFFAYLTWSKATLAKLSMTLKIKEKKVAV